MESVLLIRKPIAVKFGGAGAASCGACSGNSGRWPCKGPGALRSCFAKNRKGQRRAFSFLAVIIKGFALLEVRFSPHTSKPMSGERCVCSLWKGRHAGKDPHLQAQIGRSHWSSYGAAERFCKSLGQAQASRLAAASCRCKGFQTNFGRILEAVPCSPWRWPWHLQNLHAAAIGTHCAMQNSRRWRA